MGTVEVVVFPRDYERNAALIEADSKVFIMGRVAAEDDKASKLICEKNRLLRSGAAGTVDPVCRPETVRAGGSRTL